MLSSPLEREHIYPETVLLSINAHSSIGNDSKLFKFDEKIQDSKIIIINSTAIGVCNYATNIVVQEKNDVLLEEYRDFDKTKSIDDFIDYIVPTLKDVDKYNTYKYKLKTKDNSPESTKYLSLFSKGHNIQKKKNKDLIINKDYYINSIENEEREQTNMSNNSIKILNMSNRNNDLFDIMTSIVPRQYGRLLKLKDIIEHLNSNGVKNIIIFDFSCNEYSSVTTPRTSRHKRRYLEKELGIQILSKKRKRRKLHSSSSNDKNNNLKLFSKIRDTKGFEKPSKYRSFERISKRFTKTRKLKSI